MQLSPSEKALLQGNHNFSKAKARYVRYRINKKIRLQGRDFTSLGITTDLSSRNDIIGRDAAPTPQQQLGGNLVGCGTARADSRFSNDRIIIHERSAGSGNIVSKAPYSAFTPRN